MGTLCKVVVTSFVLSLLTFQVWSQCGSGPVPAVPANSWVGYVYDGVNNFSNYQGAITETELFDQNWPDAGTFNTTNGCAVDLATFTVRFRMTKTLACGYYTFTVGADDGVRLSLDNGATYILGNWGDQSYTTFTNTFFLTGGTYNMVLDYYENGGSNRVSFTYAGAGGPGGIVGTDSKSCLTSYDPPAFTSTRGASFCNGSTLASYQWESASAVGGPYTGIPGTNSTTYDPPALTATTYYRRRATSNAPVETVYSNVITVTVQPPPTNQTLAGNNSWVGHVYDGANNYASANYQGQFTEPDMFDESFCGANCFFAINGCDVQTETFTVRFRMTFTVTQNRNYTFTVGGDDGYRFSYSTGGGPSTTVITNYGDHSYASTTNSAVLAPGTYDFVLDYYENTGDNRIVFNYTSVLPVVWTNFTGHYADEKNFISWGTANEKNNSGFVVERSTNGTDFDSLGFVNGNGTSSQAHSYSFVDEDPSRGWNYYRLKQIDYDQQFEYSRLISVFADREFRLKMFPNPATDEIIIGSINKEQQVHVALRGILSNKIYTLINDPKQPSRFLLKDVAPGMYIVTITVDHVVYSEKLVVY